MQLEVIKLIFDSMTQNISRRFAESFSPVDNPSQQLAEYQKNMKIFIKAVQKQMASIIDKYEKYIKTLKDQIMHLKSQVSKKAGTSTALGLQSHMSQCFSPIKFKGGLNSGISGMQTARSNFLQDFPIKNLFGLDSNLYKTEQKSPSFNYKFQNDKTSDKFNRSRFQMQSKKKRQRQQELLNSLEMGKSNLQLNTDKMFTLIGRPKSCEKKDQQSQQINTPQSPTTKKRRASQAHNTSLNSICDSLNNSFHGRKAQSKSLKKKKQKQSKQGEQARKEQEREKKKKEQGIKNLLSTMRTNIESSPQKPVQVIKNSKLLTTGSKGKGVQFSNKSKVMINPVAVDVIERNKQRQQNSTTTSPSKNPQSILKNSSTNFLSKSIENISAISFHQSGGEQ